MVTTALAQHTCPDTFPASCLANSPPVSPCSPLPTHSCIYTHPQVQLPKLSLDKFTDSYFKAAEDKQKGNKGEDDFFKKGE